MRKKLESLLELQKVEIEIDRLNDLVSSVSERLSNLDAKAASFQEAYDNETTAMDLLKKKYRSLESDVQTNETQAAKSEEKLSVVKTNKEYQALLKEIEDIKEKNIAIEDDMLECLEQMEATEIVLAEKKDKLQELQIEVSSAKKMILQEDEENRKQLEESELLRDRLHKEVDAGLMADYLRVKQLIKVSAVVPVIQAVCQGCHMNIPPQMFIELQRGDQLKFCPHCDRIIFWNDMGDQ